MLFLMMSIYFLIDDKKQAIKNRSIRNGHDDAACTRRRHPV
jgi:hypothetical protein